MAASSLLLRLGAACFSGAATCATGSLAVLWALGKHTAVGLELTAARVGPAARSCA
jgi:hypothetical protein